MLFRLEHLDGIKSGKISLAFRKWRKPAVKKGGLIKTAIGQVEITDLGETSSAEISEQDAIDAGFQSTQEVLDILSTVDEGQIYKIGLRYHSADPRIKLRSQTQLTDEDFLNIKKRLDRFDRYSKDGEWTLETLRAIQENPRLKAKHLSATLGKEKLVFKLNVRKLKNLGLTISHEVGYTLSPLGEAFLGMLSKEKRT